MIDVKITYLFVKRRKCDYIPGGGLIVTKDHNGNTRLRPYCAVEALASKPKVSTSTSHGVELVQRSGLVRAQCQDRAICRRATCEKCVCHASEETNSTLIEANGLKDCRNSLYSCLLNCLAHPRLHSCPKTHHSSINDVQTDSGMRIHCNGSSVSRRSVTQRVFEFDPPWL